MSRLRMRVTAEAAKHGAAIDWAEGDTVVYADAPTGRIWDASDAHCICAAYDDSGQTFASACAFLISEMEYGTRTCHCDECNAEVAA